MKTTTSELSCYCMEYSVVKQGEPSVAAPSAKSKKPFIFTPKSPSPSKSSKKIKSRTSPTSRGSPANYTSSNWSGTPPSPSSTKSSKHPTISSWSWSMRRMESSSTMSWTAKCTLFSIQQILARSPSLLRTDRLRP